MAKGDLVSVFSNLNGSELYRIISQVQDAIVITDDQGRVVFANPSFSKLTGYTSAQLIGKSPGSLLQGPNTDVATIAEIRDALSRREPIEVEILNYSPSQRTYWVRLSISPLWDAVANFAGFMALSHDVTKNKTETSKLLNERNHHKNIAKLDSLTGLPNRRAYEEFWLECQTKGEDWIVLRIDLDWFKEINDTYGHDAGDYVLRQTAEAISSAIRSVDFAARIGGDEFIVLLKFEENARQSAEQIAARIRSTIRRTLNYNGYRFDVDASIGVAGPKPDTVEQIDIVQAADTALYEAKDRGRGAVVVFCPRLAKVSSEFRQDAQLMREGVDAGAFVPFYQPYFDALDATVRGVEVFARWHHPVKGVLPAGAFLKLSEEIGLYDVISSQVKKTALNHVKDIASEGVWLPRLNLNITSGRLLTMELIELALQNDMGGTEIVLEIQEDVPLRQRERSIGRRLSELTNSGVLISIDNFGGGLGSLKTIEYLQPHAVKISPTLVKSALQQKTAGAILRNLVVTCKELKIRTIGQGIESKLELEFLTDHGVETVQGWYLERPMSYQKLRKYLGAQRATVG